MEFLQQLNGSIIMQTRSEQFKSVYKEITKTPVLDNDIINYAASGSIHFFSQFQVITSGFLIIKAFPNQSVDEINQQVSFAFEVENEMKPIQLKQIIFNEYITNELRQLNLDAQLGVLLLLDIAGEFPKHQYNQLPIKLCQNLQQISSPLAIQGVELYQNCIRKAIVSKISKNLMLVDTVALYQMEGGSIYNLNFEYVGIILPICYFVNLNFYTLVLPFKNNNQIEKIIEITDPFIQNLINQTYSVVAKYQYGSGVIVSNKKNQTSYLVSAKHILDSNQGIQTIQIYQNHTSQYFNATTIKDYREEYLDIFIAQLNKYIDSIDIQSITNSPPKLLDEVFCVGYGLQDIDYPMVTKGRVVKLIYDKENYIGFVHDGHLYNGYSGGGVFDNLGQLIAITSFNFSFEGIGKVCDFNFALRIQSLNNQFVKNMMQLQTRFEIPLINQIKSNL